MLRIFLLVMILPFLTLGCARRTSTNGAAPSLDELAEWMTGDFDNTAALADAARQAIEEHYPIEVHLRRLPHLDSSDGTRRALYIEQASMERAERPYRQRVYFISELGGGAFVSEVWEIREPARFANAHKRPEVLASIAASDLERKEGCEVFLEWNGEQFAGGTRGLECATALAGGAYATAEVVVGRDGFTSWDRGFNTAGEQVWGAEQQPYMFARRP